MRRPVLPRRVTALLLSAALVLGQAFAAAHACLLAPVADEAVESCHHEASEQPAPDTLCKAHCEAGTQTVDQAKPLVAPALGAPVAVLRAGAAMSSSAAHGATDWLAHAGAPPPFLLHRRLRI
ncbi:MAG: hypothetical protein U1F45_20320 [Burkholderiales bacterium]